MEEEKTIQMKLPDLYNYISSHTEAEIDWTEVQEDLSDLNWLELSSSCDELHIMKSTWRIVDRWGVSMIEGHPRQKVTKQIDVKMFIIQALYSLSSDKHKSAEISSASSTELTNLLFFKKAKNFLHTGVELSDFPDMIETVVSAFKDMKKRYLTLFIHLEKYFILELKHSLSDLLDDHFNTQIIKTFKGKLLEDSTTRFIVQEFDKSYNPTYPSLGYGKPRLNHYYGEVDPDGLRCGYGKISYANGDSYEGFWQKDKPHGQGLYIWKEYGSYEGDFLDGKMTGNGKRVYSSGNVYLGQFVDNVKRGEGVMHFRQGDMYEGEWDDDQMNGTGRYTWATKDVYVGRFVKDKREGKGTLTLSSGEVYEGQWQESKLIDN